MAVSRQWNGEDLPRWPKRPAETSLFLVSQNIAKTMASQSTTAAREAAESLLLNVYARRKAPRGEQRSTLDRIPDWDSVLELAAAHGVLGLVGALVERVPTSVPDDVRRQLRARSLDATARHLLFRNQLRRVLTALDHAGVPALAIKGPVLASILDPAAPERRSCVDLDLLVRPRDVLNARDSLRRLGYRERLPLPPGHEARCIAVGKELAFDQTEQPSVDLHWRLTSSFGPLGSLEAGLWDHAIRVRVDGIEVPTLCAEHHLLFLCVHGCGHGWSRLRWVVDIAAFLENHPQLDIPALVRTARATGSVHLLLAGIGLAQHLLGTPLADPLAQMLRRDPLARAASHWYSKRIFAQDRPWARRAWSALLRQGLRNRAREGLGSLLAPTDVEWSMLRLPPGLFGLYSCLRVGRIVCLALDRTGLSWTSSK